MVREAFQEIPLKQIHCASCELCFPWSTVHNTVHKKAAAETAQDSECTEVTSKLRAYLKPVRTVHVLTDIL